MEQIALAKLQELDPGVALVIFTLMIVVDGINAVYTRFVMERRPLAAANSGAIQYVISSFAILHYTSNPLYIAFVVLGSWVGTYIVVRFPVWLGRRATPARGLTPEQAGDDRVAAAPATGALVERHLPPVLTAAMIGASAPTEAGRQAAGH